MGEQVLRLVADAARRFRLLGRGSGTFVGVDVRRSEVRLARYDRMSDGSVGINTVQLPRSELRETLGEGAARLGLSGDVPTSAAVESGIAVVRHTSLPPMPEKEVAPALAYQLPQLIPVYGDGWVHDYVLLGHRGGDSDRVGEYLVAALPRAAALEYYHSFRQAGLWLMSLEVRPLALWRYLSGSRAADRPATEFPCLAVLDPDDLTADLAVIEGGVLRYTRLLAGWEAGDGSDRIASRLASEIEQTLLWYRDRHGGTLPETLLVVGEVGTGGGLGAAIAESLGLKTFEAKPPWTNADRIDLRFAAAVGLALKEAMAA